MNEQQLTRPNDAQVNPRRNKIRNIDKEKEYSYFDCILIICSSNLILTALFL